MDSVSGTAFWVLMVSGFVSADVPGVSGISSLKFLK